MAKTYKGIADDLWRAYISLKSTGENIRDRDTCIAKGYLWITLKFFVPDSAAQQYSLDCAVTLIPKQGIPDTIIFYRFDDNGEPIFTLEKQAVFSLMDNFGFLLQDAFKTTGYFTAALGIISPTALNGLVSDLAKLQKDLPGGLGKAITDLIAEGQKAISWVYNEIDFPTLKLLNDVLMSSVPDYNAYVISLENELSAMSGKIFKNGNQISSYVHLFEMVYYNAAIKEGLTGDKAQQAMYKKEGDLLKDLRKDIDINTKNPLNVWTTIYNYTFGNKNEYLSMHDKVLNNDVIDDLKMLSDTAKIINIRIKEIGSYADAFNKSGLTDIAGTIEVIANAWLDFYDQHLNMTMQLIDKRFSENEKLVKTLNDIEEKERVQRLKALAITKLTSEQSLDDSQIQDEYLNDLINNKLIPIGNDYQTILDTIDSIGK